MTYRPKPESLAAQVLGFFALNPDEELTFEDIVAKFVQPGDSRNVHTQLMAACDHDMLAYDPDEELYRKGPVDMPPIRTLDAGDDGTGQEQIAPVKRMRKAAKLAARPPASTPTPAQPQQAPAAT